MPSRRGGIERSQGGERLSDAVKSRALHILRACANYQKGGNRNPDIWFFRGTSIEDLQHALNHGTFRGQMQTNKFGNRNDAWAGVAGSRIGSPFVDRQYLDGMSPNVPEAQAHAEGHAQMIAMMHGFLSAFGYSLNAPRKVHALMGFFHDIQQWREHPKSLGLDTLLGGEESYAGLAAEAAMLRELIAKHGRKKVERIIKHIVEEHRKGVILGINKRILERAKSLGFEDEGARLGVGPLGLRLEDVETIHVPGKDGQAYIEDLRRKLTSSQ